MISKRIKGGSSEHWNFFVFETCDVMETNKNLMGFNRRNVGFLTLKSS